MSSRGGRAGRVPADGVECAADQLPPEPELGFGSLGRRNRLVWQFISLAVGGYRRPTLATEVAGARDALSDAGIDVDASIRADGLRPDVEAVLAWAVREGATNVLRHSGARHCTIESASTATTAPRWCRRSTTAPVPVVPSSPAPAPVAPGC
jgi:two-component system sensor histidine kinase DesK